MTEGASAPSGQSEQSGRRGTRPLQASILTVMCLLVTALVIGLFSGGPGLEPEPFAEETARHIDSEIKQLVVDAHTRASDILRDRRSILGTLARRLIEQEVVEGAEVRALVAQASSSAPQPA